MSSIFLRSTIVFLSLFLMACSEGPLSGVFWGGSEAPSLKLNCATSVPEGYPYKCVSSLVSSSSLSFSKTSSFALSDYVYSIVDSTCVGLSVDSEGVVSADLGHNSGDSCSYKLQATDGSQVFTTDTIDISVTPSLTMSFSESRVYLEKGATAQRVYLQLSAPAPFDSELRFSLSGMEGLSALNGLSSEKTISISEGATSIAIDLDFPSSASFNSADYLKLRLKNGTTNPIDDLSVNLHVNAIPTFTQVSSGSAHTCAIESGNLWCWGDDGSGGVGNGAVLVDDVLAPELIDSSGTWTMVSAGSFFSCGIDAGNLKCWGSDSLGQVGNGTASSVNVESPELIDASGTWTYVSAGVGHACGIDAGNLKCWGRDTYGQVGNGSASSANVASPELIDSSGTWSSVSTGNFHACGIDAGNLKCWGRDNYGQVGNGSASSANVVSPELIDSSGTWTTITLSSYNSCGLDAGALKCWGRDSYGQIGNGSSSTADVAAPEVIGSSNLWTLLDAGHNHVCGLDNGDLKCWGDDYYGQLGNGSAANSAVEAPEVISSSGTWSQISGGSEHTCGIDDGRIKCWGRSIGGQLGTGLASAQYINSPAVVDDSGRWTAFAGGMEHSCGIDNGNLLCWGLNYYGQLGTGVTSDVIVPLPNLVSHSGQWTDLSSGDYHLCGIENGNLKCWGRNSYGQVGNNYLAAGANVLIPELISSTGTWTKVVSGSFHNCGLNDGNLMCWGQDSSGQVGNGSAASTNVVSPELIDSSGAWSDISANGFHTCGINNGNLMCWGKDNYGQLGNGSASSANVESPELIDGSGTWTAIALGKYHTCGLDNGNLKCWGRDSDGQIGNGSASTVNVVSPELVDSSGTWTSIVAGDLHTCGIDNGNLKCWGYDSFGQIGNGSASPDDVASPELIDSSGAWQKVFAGSFLSCGIENGNLKCWGSNVEGQAGTDIAMDSEFMLIDF